VLQMVTANIIIQYMLTTDSLGSNALPLNVTTMDIADTKSRIQASRPVCNGPFLTETDQCVLVRQYRQNSLMGICECSSTLLQSRSSLQGA